MMRLERIVAALGGVLLDHGRRALVRGPGHGSGDRSVSLLETDDGRILVHCFSPRDDWREVRRLLLARGLIDNARAVSAGARRSPNRPLLQSAHEDRLTRARAIWRESGSLRGSLAGAYLQTRAISRLDGGPMLRFHPRASSLEDRRRRPALVAAISDPNGAFQGVHITLLAADGSGKAKLETPRRIVGRSGRGAVRLDRADEELIVAEGIETALSAAGALGLPAWAALNAGELARFKPPGGLRRLIIAADNDEAGLVAAEKLQRSLAGRDLAVIARTPPGGCKDWNDWARSNTRQARQDA